MRVVRILILCVGTEHDESFNIFEKHFSTSFWCWTGISTKFMTKTPSKKRSINWISTDCCWWGTLLSDHYIVQSKTTKTNVRVHNQICSWRDAYGDAYLVLYIPNQIILQIQDKTPKLIYQTIPRLTEKTDFAKQFCKPEQIYANYLCIFIYQTI